MKNAILLHGTSCTPESFWFPSIRRFLESEGYDVWAPHLPQPDDPDLEVQLPYVLENGVFTDETIIIGHSAGVPLALAILERVGVGKAVLVAGFARPLGKDGTHEKIVKDFAWDAIRENVRELIVINAVNDPWGCDDDEGRHIAVHAGGKLIVNHEGHMGSDRFNQPYREFPLLVSLLKDEEQ
jgi:uncharacterized protein